jgi:hypothetical protein
MKTLAILLLVLIVLWLVIERPQGAAPSVKVLYRQAARYAVASTQDEAPVIKVLHANYAMGYLMAIKDIVTASEFKMATGKDLLNFEQEIARIQDSATLSLVEICPELKPKEDPELLKAMYA